MIKNKLSKKQLDFLEGVGHGGCQSLYRRAMELGITVEPLKTDSHIIKFSFGGKKIYVRRGYLPTHRMLGIFTRYKSTTKSVLADGGLRVPKGIIIGNKQRVNIKDTKLRTPLIIKPDDSSRAIGLSWNIMTQAELDRAIVFARKADNRIIVEEKFEGDEYRVLVYRGRVVSAVHKIPATIIGDGICTVKELIENFDKTRADGFKINVDKIVRQTLREHGLTMKSVLPRGRSLKLRNNVNMSDGGRCINKTRQFTKAYKDICIKAVSLLNIEMGGVDIIIKNIQNPKSYVILEVNPNPYINMHEASLVEGPAVDVSELILKNLFPSLR